MVLGKAVIAANVPSVEIYLKEGALLWYEPENVEILREQMQRLMEDPQLCAELGSRAEYLVKTEFNEKNMAAGIERMIEAVMEIK